VRKRGRKIKQDIVARPAGSRDHWALEGRVLATLVSIQSGAITDDQEHDLAALAILAKGLGEDTHSKSVLHILESCRLRGWYGSMDLVSLVTSARLLLNLVRDSSNIDILKSVKKGRGIDLCKPQRSQV
jgi:hypothetical protein